MITEDRQELPLRAPLALRRWCRENLQNSEMNSLEELITIDFPLSGLVGPVLVSHFQYPSYYLLSKVGAKMCHYQKNQPKVVMRK